MERAYWLTTKVETGATFGTVMAYDGTAMTAGPDQHIAVYPQELAAEDYNAADDQGDLWKLLRRLEMGGEAPADYYHALGDLWAFFKSSMEAYVAQDGVLRYLEAGEYHFPAPGSAPVKYSAGSTVFGHHIRSALTPSEGPDRGLGQVPKSGKEWETAAHVAELFFSLMSHSNGRQIQIEFGKEHLVERTKTRKAPAAEGWRPISDIGYSSREVSSLRVGVDGWTEELDLALCFYQSNSVNAPAIANRILGQAWGAYGHNPTTVGYAKGLIKALGLSHFGQWNESLATGRYQRTRTAAMNSGLWSKELFTGPSAIMPA